MSVQSANRPRKYTESVLRVVVDSTLDWFESRKWDALVESDPDATPFQTREWAAAWWRHYGRGKRPFMLQAFDSDELVGLYPLFERQSAWRAIRPIGVGPSDYLKPIARSGCHEPVADAFLRHLASENALIDLHQWPFDVAPDGAIEQATCLVVDLPPTFDQYLSRLSKSLRYDAKRVGRDSKLTLRDDVDPAEALHILLDQHERRWKSRGLPGAFVGKARRFHQDWAQVAHRNGWLRLTVLESEGRPIGAIYAMTMGKACYYYQAGFDPAYKSVSPGTVLVSHAISRAIDEGVTKFDFCRGDEPYKRRWKPDHVVTNCRILLPGPALGRVGAGWNRLAWRVEHRVRRRLEGGRLWPPRAEKA